MSIFAVFVLLLAACGPELNERRRAPSTDVASRIPSGGVRGDVLDGDRPGGSNAPQPGAELPQAMTSTPAPALAYDIYLNNATELYGLDTETMELELIGTFHFRDGTKLNFMRDLAIARDGTLYGGSFGFTCTQPFENMIVRIDPQTAEVTKLFEPEVATAGLEIVDEGLIIAGVEVALYDIATGDELRRIVDKPKFWTAGDVVELADGKLLWMTEQFNTMFRIDPDTGDALFVRSLQYPFGSMIRYHGDLWAFIDRRIARVWLPTLDIRDDIGVIPWPIFISGAAVHPDARD